MIIDIREGQFCQRSLPNAVTFFSQVVLSLRFKLSMDDQAR